MSGNSTLDPDNVPALPDRELGKGHGTGALGPSDSSDSGSDVRGGPEELELESDTDAAGTGERAEATHSGRTPDGSDIDVDHIESMPADGDTEAGDVERP